ncbi:hypothetical protein CP157_03567 (plasmid) [Paracoccus marcusii]|nr:hypothetical protein CP157_03567 [Paracoccus marcusii]
MRMDVSAFLLSLIRMAGVHHRVGASAKLPLRKLLPYITKRCDGFGRYLKNGCVKIDSNTEERKIRKRRLNPTLFS